MEKTGVVIGRDSWLLLQAEPLYSARFIEREGTDELALVVRVEELEWFVEAGLPVAVALCSWQSSRGVWLAAVAYELYPICGETKAGLFCVNPCQVADATLLDKLPCQKRLAVIFLSADCTTHYTIGLPQDDEQRAAWRAAIARTTPPASGLSADQEAAFEAACAEFQDCYSPRDILRGAIS